MSPVSRAELAGIERVFHLGDSEVHALRNLNLDIDAGEYVAVMGPSGSGKSTLLNLLGLLDRPNAGLYRLEGRDVTTLSPDEQARVRSQRIGFVFQSFHLVPRLTAAENIALPMVLAGLPPSQRASVSGRPSRTMAWRTAPTTGLTNCPAASASAWPSRAPPSCSRP
jgi:putative ABC transport system ATP-binding protein